MSIPLNMMVAITGVSGSGKSTLVHDVIYQIAGEAHESRGASAADDAEAWGAAPEKLTCRKVEKADLLTQVVLVDQSPIGRTPRSNPVTYIKAFDIIRELFASTTEADRRGYTAGHFSFNIPGGPLRNLPGRRHGDRRDAVPGRRRTGLRRLQGHALQAERSGRAISRPEYPRSVAAHGEGSDLVLLGDAAAGAEAASAERRRPGISAAGPIRDHAFRRRSAAREAGRAPGAGHQRRNALHLRRAHHRPALRRHRQAAGCVRAAAALRRAAF